MNSDAKRAAVGYIRTSTEKQEDSPEAQKLALEAWGRVNGFELRSFYVERVSSGVRLFERTALLDAIEDLKAGEMVVAVARDRFSRNTAKMVMIEHLVERAGGELATADGLGGTGSIAVFTRAVMDAVAALEKAQISARTLRVMQSKRRKGEKISRIPPYGTKHVGQRVVVHPGEQATIKAIVRWRAMGESWAKIVAHLESSRHKPRGTRWHIRTVRNIVKRADEAKTS